MVLRAVTMVRDRFGASGLRDVISLAERELAEAEAALAELADLAPDAGPAGPADQER